MLRTRILPGLLTLCAANFTFPAHADEATDKLARGIVAELPKGRPFETGLGKPLPDFAALAGYEATPADTALRKQIKEAIDFLDEQREVFDAKVTGGIGNMKDQAERAQRRLGMTLLDLDDSISSLRSAQEQLKKEPSKRWRALHAFVLAELLQRRVFCTDYNYAMGLVRSDDVPANNKGYRLSYDKKIHARGREGRAAKEMYDEAVLLLKGIVKDHPGTPYAELAKRQLERPAGLTWQAKD